MDYVGRARGARPQPPCLGGLLLLRLVSTGTPLLPLQRAIPRFNFTRTRPTVTRRTLTLLPNPLLRWTKCITPKPPVTHSIHSPDHPLYWSLRFRRQRRYLPAVPRESEDNDEIDPTADKVSDVAFTLLLFERVSHARACDRDTEQPTHSRPPLTRTSSTHCSYLAMASRRILTAPRRASHGVGSRRAWAMLASGQTQALRTR